VDAGAAGPSIYSAQAGTNLRTGRGRVPLLPPAPLLLLGTGACVCVCSPGWLLLRRLRPGKTT
jgi:hypothetical protein